MNGGGWVGGGGCVCVGRLNYILYEYTHSIFKFSIHPTSQTDLLGNCSLIVCLLYLLEPKWLQLLSSENELLIAV